MDWQRPLQKVIELTLRHPRMFEWQQSICNNYGNIRKEFERYYGQSGLRILDIGCSTGTCAGQVVDMDRNQYVGIDISDEYIKRAQRLYPKGTFVAMDAAKLTFPENSFDLITFQGVLHHMDDALIQNALASIQKVLKSSGKVLVAEPVFTPKKYISNFLLSLDRGKYIRSAEEYKNLFQGFVIESEGFFPFSAHRFYSLVAAPFSKKVQA